MKVLVTGSRGFVGRNMVGELTERGHDVHGVDIEESRFSSEWNMDAVDFFRTTLSRGIHWDLVVHCAYNIGGRAGIEGRAGYLAKNMMLDAGLFDWADPDYIGQVLYFSSSAVYPVWLQSEAFADPTQLRPVRLKEALTDGDAAYRGVPDGRYGFAKMAGEELAQSYRDRGGLVTVVRPFSGYGADQSLDYPFPAFVKRAKDERVQLTDQFEIWGSARSTRDWIHIDDVVNGALQIAQSQVARRFFTPVNLCTGRSTMFGELAGMMLKAAGVPGIPIVERKDRPTGVFNRVGDPTKMLAYYTPQVSLEDGIQEAFS